MRILKAVWLAIKTFLQSNRRSNVQSPGFSDLSTNKPGRTGQPLDGTDRIIRLGIVDQVKDDQVSPKAFEMSSKEKEQELKRISAWETSLTTSKQAYDLVVNPKRKVVITLLVDDIQQITVDSDSPLNVLWDRMPDCIDESGRRKVGYRDGCMGHCGITGLDFGNKVLRKKLRRRLADLATRSRPYMIDDIPF